MHSAGTNLSFRLIFLSAMTLGMKKMRTFAADFEEGMKDRDLRIDVLKGVGIICVIWAHLRGYLDMEIYIFHMPLFFFLSGMFYRQKRNFVWTRFRSLIIPFVLYSLFFAALFWWQGGGWLKPLHRISWWFPSAIVGPSWFLIALFNISVVYYLLDLLVKDNRILLAITFAIGLTFYYWKVELPLDLRQSFYALPFYSLGAFMKQKEWTKPTRNRWVLGGAALAFAGTVVYCRVNNFRFDVLCSYLPANAALFYGGALASIILLLNVRYFSKPTHLNSLLASFGRNSLAIMALHMPYMYFLKRWILRQHYFADNATNAIATFYITFLVITIGSYLLALAIASRRQIPWKAVGSKFHKRLVHQ